MEHYYEIGVADSVAAFWSSAAPDVPVGDIRFQI